MSQQNNKSLVEEFKIVDALAQQNDASAQQNYASGLKLDIEQVARLSREKLGDFLRQRLPHLDQREYLIKKFLFYGVDGTVLLTAIDEQFLEMCNISAEDSGCVMSEIEKIRSECGMDKHGFFLNGMLYEKKIYANVIPGRRREVGKWEAKDIVQNWLLQEEMPEYFRSPTFQNGFISHGISGKSLLENLSSTSYWMYFGQFPHYALKEILARMIGKLRIECDFTHEGMERYDPLIFGHLLSTEQY